MGSAEKFSSQSQTHGSAGKQQHEDREEIMQRVLQQVLEAEKGQKKKRVRYLDDKALYDASNPKH